MNIERTLMQLQVMPETPERARELGQLGYMQWLGGLPGAKSYEAEARRALEMACPFAKTDMAVAAFCALVEQSLSAPLTPLYLALPKPRRRGGAQDRRMKL